MTAYQVRSQLCTLYSTASQERLASKPSCHYNLCSVTFPRHHQLDRLYIIESHSCLLHLLRICKFLGLLTLRSYLSNSSPLSLENCLHFLLCSHCIFNYKSFLIHLSLFFSFLSIADSALKWETKSLAVPGRTPGLDRERDGESD